MMAKEEDPLERYVTVAQAAALCGRSPSWVKQLRSEGFIPTGRGRARLCDVIAGVVAYYEDRLKDGTKSAAANRATEARTREIELRTAERARRLIPIEDSLAIHAELAQRVRTEFSGLPARITRDVELRRKMEVEIDGIFSRLAERTRQRGEDLRTGRVDVDDLGNSDTL